MKGVFDWAVIRPMALMISNPFLAAYSHCNPEVLLNNFSKSYPNLSPIANANTLKHKKEGKLLFLIKKYLKENVGLLIDFCHCRCHDLCYFVLGEVNNY